jgi:hypothetical protein
MALWNAILLTRASAILPRPKAPKLLCVVSDMAAFLMAASGNKDTASSPRFNDIDIYVIARLPLCSASNV